MTDIAGIKQTKKQPNKGVRLMLTNVTLMYVKHSGYGVLEYGEQPVEDKPWANHRYECDVLINKEIKKELKAAHKKVGIKEFTAEEFKNTFKIDPPFEADEYLVTKLYREAYFGGGARKGEEARRVTVKDKTGASLEDVGIGNGSVGNVIVNITPYDNKFGKGTSMRLGSMQIVDHVEFDLDGGNDDDEFEFEDYDIENDSTEGDDDWDE